MEIFKKDSKGKIRSLTIEAIDGYLIQTSGLLDGKKVEHKKLCKAKNVGRSNETDPMQQADLQSIALITKKLREGYFYDINDARDSEVVMPMLAKVYEDEAHKVDWSTAYANRKYDGMRMLGKENTLLSRKSVPITTLGHIMSQLVGVTEWIDGEAYAHGETFQGVMKLVKKYRAGETEMVKIHAYDLISPLPYIQRFYKLRDLVKDIDCIELVIPTKVDSYEEFVKYNDESLELGYEGSMLRWGNEGYKVNGRSSNLLKFKQFMDLDAEIIDIEPSDANPEFGVPVLRYTHDSGLFDGKTVEFRAGCRLSHEERRELLSNKDEYIGMMGNIRFFEYTDEGNIRFPVYIGAHLDR